MADTRKLHTTARLPSLVKGALTGYSHAHNYAGSSSPLLVKGILKGRLREALDGLLGVVHAHAHACSIKVLHLPPLRLTATIRCEDQLQLARLGHM